ncbi:MAG: 50S ribosomal protein L10 [bacterium]
MPKSKQQKEEIVKNLIDKLNKSKSTIFVDYKGLKVKELDELRQECGKQESEYFVAKKTLIKVAAGSKTEGLDPKGMEGNLAMVFGYQDEIVPARIVKNFAKKYKMLRILGGVVENRYIDENMVKNLADIPSRPELYAKLLGSLNAPISGFVNVFSGVLRNFVGVLDAVRESRRCE